MIQFPKLSPFSGTLPFAPGSQRVAIDDLRQSAARFQFLGHRRDRVFNHHDVGLQFSHGESAAVSGHKLGVGGQGLMDFFQDLDQSLRVAAAGGVGIREGPEQHQIPDTGDPAIREVDDDISVGMTAGQRKNANEIPVEMNRRVPDQSHVRQALGLHSRESEVGAHSAADLRMGDDHRPLSHDRVAAGVVRVTMGVDDDPDRAAAEHVRFVLEGRSGRGIAGVDQQGAVVADRRHDTDVSVAPQLIEIVGDSTDLDRWRRFGLLGHRPANDHREQYNEHFQESIIHSGTPFIRTVVHSDDPESPCDPSSGVADNSSIRLRAAAKSGSSRIDS